MTAPGRMDVGPGDALRCAFSLLLPSWFHAVGLLTAAFAAAGAWSPGANTVIAIAGFAVAAGVEVVRRLALLGRPSGGQAATALLRTWTVVLPIMGVAAVALLAADLGTSCFGQGCGEDARIALWLWLALCALSLATTPMLIHMRRRSDWLQPRTGTAGTPS